VSALRPVSPADDAELLHQWVTHPRSRFWDMQSASVDDVRRAYTSIDLSPHHNAWLGRLDGPPQFLCETYDPAHSELADAYDVRDGDLGMHFLVAPTDTPVHGFTRRVMDTVMRHCFADPDVHRVVVEPDARNHRVHVLNAAVGFAIAREVRLSDKTALLGLCTRDRYFQGADA
jgi:RimJ/RimL family protein N-acetyltransferase